MGKLRKRLTKTKYAKKCSLPEPEPVQEIVEPAPKPNALKELTTAPLKKKRRRRSSSRKAKASTKKANS